jgi:catechol 2,3-dioxygenase-like lactoylglutathione lyase family enzyme
MKLAEIAFFTDNVVSMTEFYRRLLGVAPVASSDTMAIFFSNETKIFIHHRYAPKNGELPPEDHLAFAVEDVDRMCAQLLQQGLMLEVPPQDFYWGRSAYLRDPDGHQIEIMHMEKSYAG